jgi:hypothetical protein
MNLRRARLRRGAGTFKRHPASSDDMVSTVDAGDAFNRAPTQDSPEEFRVKTLERPMPVGDISDTRR